MGGIGGGSPGVTIPFNQHLLLGADNTYDLGSAANGLRYAWIRGGINSITGADNILFRDSTTAVRFAMGTGVANVFFRPLTDAIADLGGPGNRWADFQSVAGNISGFTSDNISTNVAGFANFQAANSQMLIPTAAAAAPLLMMGNMYWDDATDRIVVYSIRLGRWVGVVLV